MFQWGMRFSQRGNILFLILLAIILFVALTVAVRDSMKGGGKNVKDERAQAIAATVNDMLGHTQISLQRFLLTKGYTIENIDLYDATNTSYGTGNANSCSTDACNLFHPAGGNASVPLLPASARSQFDTSGCGAPYFTSSGEIKPYIAMTSVKNVGTNLPDVVLYYCGVEAKVCEALNVANNLKNFGDAPINADLGSGGTDYETFTGAFTNPMAVTTPNHVGAADNRINGQYISCTESESAGTMGYGNALIAVILAR